MMIIAPSKRIGILVTALALLASAGAIAQEKPSESSQDTKASMAHPQDESKNPKKKLNLSEVTRVSTDEAARKAAAEATKDKSKNQVPDRTADGTEDAVSEFKPASQEADLGSKSPPTVSAKPARKNIHGTVSGSLDPATPGNHQTTAAVGAKSKGGKLNVYVETERTRSTTQAAH